MKTELARRQMVDQQIRTFEVFDKRVLNVLTEMPREEFVPPPFVDLAFAETKIPLGHGQFMMTPTVEGRLLQSLALRPEDEVLEIGTGSGFLCACLAKLARAVTSVDIFEDFTETAGKKLAHAGLDNVSLFTMDATKSLPAGKFDAIAVTGSCPLMDPRFFNALKPGGRLFVIAGLPPVMEAQLITKGADQEPEVTSLFETNVLPLINAPAPPAFRF